MIDHHMDDDRMQHWQRCCQNTLNHGQNDYHNAQDKDIHEIEKEDRRIDEEAKVVDNTMIHEVDKEDMRIDEEVKVVQKYMELKLQEGHLHEEEVLPQVLPHLQEEEGHLQEKEENPLLLHLLKLLFFPSIIERLKK